MYFTRHHFKEIAAFVFLDTLTCTTQMAAAASSKIQDFSFLQKCY